MIVRFCIFLLFASPAFTQDPLTLLPRNYRLQFENNAVRVIRVHYAPHEKLPVHDHPANPTAYVYLSDSGPVHFSHVEERAFSITRQPLKTGEFRVSPGRLEKHSIENQGAIPSDFLRVELKTIPLGSSIAPYRERHPVNLAKTGTILLLDSPFLTVSRIVVAARSPKLQCAGARSGLLVTFSPARVGPERKHLSAGDVFWEPNNFDVEAEAAVPAHLLWITLK